MLEDMKSALFFKVFDVIAELGGPTLIRDSTLISPDELQVELSKLKDKWAREFNNMSYFFEDSMGTWTVDYVNLNNNIFVTIDEACDDLIEVEKEIFEMEIKKEITVAPLQDFIFYQLGNQLVVVVETA